MVALSLIAVVLAALAYAVFTWAGFRAGTDVLLVAGSSAACALIALIVQVVQVARRRRRKLWLVLLAIIVAVEGAMVAGLNRAADARLGDAAALLQDYSAEVVADASMLASIAAGNSPAGVDALTVSGWAGDVRVGIALMAVPGVLRDYAKAIDDSAASVENAALAASAGTTATVTPAQPFRISLSADQASAALADAQAEIDNLVQFGDRALKDRNAAGIRYVAARLIAQAYWLSGIRSSQNNTSPAGFLHFIDQPPAGGTTPPDWNTHRAPPVCHGGLCVDDMWRSFLGMTNAVSALALSCSSADGTFNSTADCAARQQDTGLVADWAASVTGLSAPSGVQPTSSLQVAPLRFALNKGDVVSLIPPAGTQSRVENLTVDPGEAAGATVLRVKTFRPRENWPICTPVIFNYVTYLNQRTPGGYEELIGPCGSGVATGRGGVSPTPATDPAFLQQFQNDCAQTGGRQRTTPAGSEAVGGMPVTEGGWLCTQPVTHCVTIMTYSGSEYSNGPFGCPQKGLGPSLPVPPVPGPSSSGGRVPSSSGGPVPTESGTVPPEQGLPPGFPHNLTTGRYSIEGCIQVPNGTGQFNYRGIAWGRCHSGGSVTIDAGDALPLVQAIDAAEQCNGNGCTREWSTFDGSVFYALDTMVDCSAGVCSKGYVLLRITTGG